MRRTKIVCTIGPATSSKETLAELITAGMDVARLNFSHGTAQWHSRMIKTIREQALLLGKPVAILQDLAGPKIRIGLMQKGGVTVKPGSIFVLTTRQVVGNAREASVSYPDLPRDVKPGDTILLSDGALEFKVLECVGENIECEVVVGGELSSNKGINLPTGTIRAPVLSEEDRRDLEFGLDAGVDYVALSFVKEAEEIIKVKNIIEGRRLTTPVVAKIERHEALDSIDAIIDASDAIMVARGDLAVETSLERVPLVQKMLIKKANALAKPVITATQMLKSMVDNRRPTRAEASDVANAIFDGSDAVMLSEETAVGKYPVEAVEMMGKLALAAESVYEYGGPLKLGAAQGEGVAEAIGQAACFCAQSLRAKAIITPTRSGSTARMVARYRPAQPIVAASPFVATVRRLSLLWGVYPFLVEPTEDMDQMIARAKEVAAQKGFAKKGDMVIITAGHPPSSFGSTNLIKVEVI